jgi:alpha-ketoglutarate-dependent taurine dioxygenase
MEIVMLKVLPYVWTASAERGTDLPQVLREHRQELDRLVLEHGAVLLKRFDVGSLEKFHRCTEVLADGAAGSYIDGNSPRTKLSESIYTSTEYPPELSISMHNELSYSHAWPARLYFCCVTAPQTGGSTLIADSRALLRELSPEVLDMFEKKGVTYVRNLHGGSGATIGKSWQQTFETDQRAVVEQYCKDGRIDYEWKADGGIRLIQQRPATAVHPRTGERVWFNQVDQFHPSTNPPDVYEAIMEIYGADPFEMPQYGCFGDGSPIPDDALAEVRQGMDRLSVAFPWEVGDMMIIDNMLTAHGRSPFTGTRRILVSMSN